MLRKVYRVHLRHTDPTHHVQLSEIAFSLVRARCSVARDPVNHAQLRCECCSHRESGALSPAHQKSASPLIKPTCAHLIIQGLFKVYDRFTISQSFVATTPMASSAHPSFPPRQYGSNLGKLPDRSLGATFGASTAQQKREHERAERERERLERERIEREEQNQLTEEQREEIKEAVCKF